jgi:hypothetical protein
MKFVTGAHRPDSLGIIAYVGKALRGFAKRVAGEKERAEQRAAGSSIRDFAE